jgi:hypothetical protein
MNIMLETLRKLVRSVLAEDEERLRKLQEPGTSSVEDKLLDAGIVPIKRQQGTRYTSMLGRGEYATSFEVLYDGHRAVAKVTDSARDIDNAMHLESLRHEVPKDVAKHIMIVHKYLKIPETNLECIVVELLHPLSTNMMKEYWGSGSFGEKDYNRFELRQQALADKMDEFLYEMFLASNLRHVLDKNDMRSLRNRLMSNPDFLLLSKELLSTKKPIETYLYKIFVKELSAKQFKDKLDRKKYDVGQMAEALSNMLVDYAYPFVKGDKVPMSARSKTQLDMLKLSEDKRVKSFVRALEYLKSKHGVEYFDMHRFNVMMRPSTGDLVISDPGLFRVPAHES